MMLALAQTVCSLDCWHARHCQTCSISLFVIAQKFRSIQQSGLLLLLLLPCHWHHLVWSQSCVVCWHCILMFESSGFVNIPFSTEEPIGVDTVFSSNSIFVADLIFRISTNLCSTKCLFILVTNAISTLIFWMRLVICLLHWGVAPLLQPDNFQSSSGMNLETFSSSPFQSLFK